MKTEILIRPAKLDDCFQLADRLREADILEIEAVSGLPAADELARSFTNSIECWTVTVDAVPVAMFGVSRCEKNLPGHGLIWLLAGKEADDPQSILGVGKLSRQWYDSISIRYSCLYNFVDSANLTSIKWLKWLGFSMRKLHIGYAGGRSFFEFDNLKR